MSHAANHRHAMQAAEVRFPPASAALVNGSIAMDSPDKFTQVPPGSRSFYFGSCDPTFGVVRTYAFLIPVRRTGPLRSNACVFSADRRRQSPSATSVRPYRPAGYK